MMHRNEPIVLASASPRRQEILTLAGVPFEVHPATDEQAPDGLPPSERVQALARSKAAQVASRYPDRLILGADTMVVRDGEMLGKPATPEQAVDMLMSLQGRAHQVLTGVWLIRTAKDGSVSHEAGFTDAADVRFFSMTQEQAQAYVDTGEPMDNTAVPIWNIRQALSHQGFEHCPPC